MNNELLQKLINADRICKQANVHYQEAVKLEQQDMEQQASTKKSAKIKGIILGYSIYKKGQGEFKAESAKRQKAIEKEKAAAQQIFDNNVNDLAFLPVDYWYPLATEYLVKVVPSR